MCTALPQLIFSFGLQVYADYKNHIKLKLRKSYSPTELTPLEQRLEALVKIRDFAHITRKDRNRLVETVMVPEPSANSRSLATFEENDNDDSNSESPMYLDQDASSIHDNHLDSAITLNEKTSMPAETSEPISTVKDTTLRSKQSLLEHQVKCQVKFHRKVTSLLEGISQNMTQHSLDTAEYRRKKLELLTAQVELLKTQNGIGKKSGSK